MRRWLSITEGRNTAMINSNEVATCTREKQPRGGGERTEGREEAEEVEETRPSRLATCRTFDRLSLFRLTGAKLR
jgi:hypothetical protein